MYGATPKFFCPAYKCPDGMRYFCLNHPIRRWVFHLYVNKIGPTFVVNFFLDRLIEQFLNDLPAFKNQVLDFIKIKAADMAMPPLKRISSGNLHKEITNYNEVEQALSGTPYEKYLLP